MQKGLCKLIYIYLDLQVLKFTQLEKERKYVNYIRNSILVQF